MDVAMTPWILMKKVKMNNPCAEIPLGYHYRLEAVAGYKDLERVKGAAEKVRALAEKLYRPTYDCDLTGWCLDCTMLLWSLLPEGTPCVDDEDSHIWLYFKGMIVDVTASQFRIARDRKICIEPWTEKTANIFSFWTKNEMEKERAEREWVSTIKYLNNRCTELGIEKPEWLPEPMCRHGMKFEGPDQCPECEY